MKKILCLTLLVLVLGACSKSKTGSLTVSGTIDGLKKGTLYLQKFSDTIMVKVDSIQLQGEGSFVLVDEIESPEMYYITLDKKADDAIAFFAEQGTIQIESKLSKFSTAATIVGSKNQELLEEHNTMARQFNDQQLDFVKERFDAQKENDTARMAEIDAEEMNLLKRKMLFTTNFAVNHGDAEVAPYLALTELYYVNLSLLDTINKSLSPEVKASKYGVELEKLVTGIKDSEKEE